MMRRSFLRACALALCAAALMLPATASAAMVMEAEMGYGGSITYARMVPVWVRLTNDGPDAAGRVVMDVNRNENEYDRYEMPLTIASGSTVEVSLPVVLTQRQNSYAIRWEVDGQTVAQREISPGSLIDPTMLIVGTLGGDPANFASFSISSAADPLSRGEYWATVPLTADTFPADAESLRFFDMLAVDGFDLSALSAEQKQALDEWLRGGGVAFVGGGARAAEDYSFFEPYTGIAAGALSDGGDVTAELLEAFGVNGTPLGRDVMTVALEGASGQPVGSPALADVTRVEEGYVVTAAFSLSEAPLNGWLGRNAVWQRLLIDHAKQRYDAMVSARHSGGYAGRLSYVNTGVTSAIGVENGGLSALPMVVVGAFVLLAGVGAYWLLRRLDRREWMWAVVPGLAAAASLALWAMSASLPLQKPVAVYYTVVNVDEDGAQERYTAVTASKADREPMTVGATSGAISLTDSFSYYAYSDPLYEESAGNLRYTCTYGPTTTITYPGGQAWTSRSFIVLGVPGVDMSGVSGLCRWEGDRLTCTVTNGSSVALSGGVFLTERGYATVGELLPGQTATVSLAPRAEPVKSGEEVIADGVLLDDQEMQRYSFYEVISACATADESMSEEERREANIRGSLIQSFDYDSGYGGGSAILRFLAFSDELSTPALEIDGKPVERLAGRGVVNVKLSYDPISADGNVRFLRGSFPVYSAELGADGRPAAAQELGTDRYQSFPLLVDQLFAFDVSAVPGEIRLTDLSITNAYAYSSMDVSLYNPESGEWDLLKRYTMSSGGISETAVFLPDFARYAGDGFLYVRYSRPDTETDYADIGMPVLTLEGRVE